MDQRVYSIGATAISVTAGATALLIQPMRNQCGWQLQVLSGGSSGVAIVNSYGLTASAGYLLGTNTLQINGPAEFFLVAQGSNAVVSALMYRDAGYSLFP